METNKDLIKNHAKEAMKALGYSQKSVDLVEKIEVNKNGWACLYAGGFEIHVNVKSYLNKKIE